MIVYFAKIFKVPLGKDLKMSQAKKEFPLKIAASG